MNWFNPLVWKVAQAISTEREQSCDDQVLALGTRSSDYASNLLEISQAVRQRWMMRPGVLAMGQSSDLGRRIRHILDIRQSRRPLTRTKCLILLLLVAILLLPFSTMQLAHVSAQNNRNAITISLGLPPDIKTYLEDSPILNEFENAHPGVTVKLVESPDVPDPADNPDAYFTAMNKYAASADVLSTATYGNSLAVTPHGTRAGYFLDMTPLVNADSSLNVDDFYPSVWKSYQWDNGIWALPVSTDLMIFSYDKTAFDHAGIAYPDDKWTIDDFANAVTKLIIKDPAGHITTPGFSNTGRIYRIALWQSLLDTKLFDDSIVPNPPSFNKPTVVKILDTYRGLEQSGYIGGGDPIPLIVDDARHILRDQTRSAALLPGGHAGLLTAGLAISAGTQHPELSYELAKFLTTRGELNVENIPARKSVAQAMGAGAKSGITPDTQAFIEIGLAGGIPFADMRFTSYLNSGYYTANSAQDAVLQLETRATNDLKAADAKKGTLALTINEPVAPVLPAGKIALNFAVTSTFTPLPTKDQWDKVIQDFTASDPQVGMINLWVAFQSPADAAAKSDCFYYPTNIVPSMSANTLLPLDPFLNADTTYNKSDLPPTVVASVQRDNQTYGLPLDIQPLILRYSTASFGKAKLTIPTNTWTIDNFVDALKALKPDKETDAPFVDNGSDGIYLLVLMASSGGVPLDYRTTPPTINFTASADAIRQVLDLAKGNYLKYGALGDLRNPANVFPLPSTVIYPSTLDGFPGKKTALGTSPDTPILFPMGHQFTGFAYDLGAAYISAKTAYPEACYRFISTIAQHPELFSTMPVRHSMLTSPALKAVTSPDVLALYNQADALLKDPNTIPLPMFSKGNAILTNLLLQHWLFEAFDSYVLTGSDLDSALKDAENYAKGYLTCAGNLPPVNMADVQDVSDVRAYADCAEKVDPRLKAVIH